MNERSFSHKCEKIIFFQEMTTAKLWLKTDWFSIDIPDLIKLKYMKTTCKNRRHFSSRCLNSTFNFPLVNMWIHIKDEIIIVWLLSINPLKLAAASSVCVCASVLRGGLTRWVKLTNVQTVVTQSTHWRIIHKLWRLNAAVFFLYF